MAIFERKFTVGLRDVGYSNVLTNKGFLGFFEDIAGLYSDMVGYGLLDIERTKLSWVLLNWKLEIIKRPEYGDTVNVKTWSRNPQKFYSYRDFEMYDSMGNIVARATSKWCLININTGLTKLDDELIARYESESISTFEELDITKIKQPTSFISTYTYTVPRYSIDINEHMHNLYYLDVAYETLPYDIYKNCTFNNLEVMYKKSSRLGDSLKCFYSKVRDEHFVTIKSSDEKDLHCIIKLS